jgi:hypothetical protein
MCLFFGMLPVQQPPVLANRSPLPRGMGSELIFQCWDHGVRKGHRKKCDDFESNRYPQNKFLSQKDLESPVLTNRTSNQKLRWMGQQNPAPVGGKHPRR